MCDFVINIFSVILSVNCKKGDHQAAHTIALVVVLVQKKKYDLKWHANRYDSSRTYLIL